MMRRLLWCSFLIFLAGCGQAPDTLFHKIKPGQSGVSFKNILRETEDFNVLTYSYFYNGGGVVIGDLNNDRLADIYFTGNLVASHLYLNKGNFSFQEVAAQAGVEAAGLWNTGVTLADVNQDGWMDLYVCRSAAADPNARRNLLFINQGVGDDHIPTFVEQASEYGLDDPAYSTQASFFDFDRDGDLDMYLLNHSVPEYSNFNSHLGSLKTRTNPNFGDKLYENQEGKFVDISQEAGIISNVLGFGLGVATADFNGDDWVDIYVSNDFNEEDYLYLNNQDGTFQESLRQKMAHTSLFSMGSDAADVDNNGHVDLFSLDMLPEDNYRIKLTSGADNYDKYQLLLQQGFHRQSMRNMLQMNLGDGIFAELGQLAGVSNSDWSWSALIADYDLDGWQDIFVTNGYLRDYTNMDFLAYAVDLKLEDESVASEDQMDKIIEKMPRIEVPDKMYHNMGSGIFSDSTITWGFSQPTLSNGAAYGDLDNDGDLDLVINHVNQVASVFRNFAVEKNRGNYLKIKFDTERGKRNIISSKIFLHAGGSVQFRNIATSKGYQSSSDLSVYFGLGDLTKIDSLVVIWPEGDREKFDFVPINSLLILKKGTGARSNKIAQSKDLVFQQGKPLFTHQHKENSFNDFRVQSLIPQLQSRQGPDICIVDLNRDRVDDVIIGGANGFPTAAYLGNSQGDYEGRSIFPASDTIFEDASISVIDANGDTYPDLVIASGGNAYARDDPMYAVRLYLNDNGQKFNRDEHFPDIRSHANTVSVGDLNHDGLPDIFVGGNYQAQQYPLAQENYVLYNQGDGRFLLAESLPFRFSHTACSEIADVNHDQIQDLVIAGDWEKVQVWSQVNQEWTLLAENLHTGWYGSLTLANLDDDADLEIIVGNFGLNSPFSATEDQPIVLYHGDFDDNGTIDPILSIAEEGQLYPYVARDDLIQQLPMLKKNFTSYANYARTNMDELLSRLPPAESDTVTSLHSIVLDLQGNKLDKIDLPREIQSAPIYAIHSFDYDLDGDQDLLMAGNNSYNRIKTGEINANYGLLLENRGEFDFALVPATLSGMKLDGDVRSIASLTDDRLLHLLIGVNDDHLASFQLSLPSNPN